MTAVAGSVFTAAQFNTFVRDNLAETAPAKAVTPSGYFVVDGTNLIAERTAVQSLVTTSETSTSTAYTDLATVGPTVTVTTGGAALVSIGAKIGPVSTGTNSIWMSYEVSGASTIGTSDTNALNHLGLGTTGEFRASQVHLLTGLTPGSNTFTAKYKVGAGTGTWAARRLVILPF